MEIKVGNKYQNKLSNFIVEINYCGPQLIVYSPLPTPTKEAAIQITSFKNCFVEYLPTPKEGEIWSNGDSLVQVKEVTNHFVIFVKLNKPDDMYHVYSIYKFVNGFTLSGGY